MGVRLTLIDTMGFPDPDSDKAAIYYDMVVTKAVNDPDGLNAVVWILDGGQSRKDKEAMQRFAVLMNQLASCRCKFIVVVNGKQRYNEKKKNVQQIQKRQNEDRQQLFENCKNLLEFIGISKGADGVERDITIIPSTTLDELEDCIPGKLMAEIIDSECVVSSVRTYESILMAYTSEKSAMKEMEKAKKEAEEKRSKAAAQHERELQQIKQR